MSVRFENVEPIKEFTLDYAIKDLTTKKDMDPIFLERHKDKNEVIDEKSVIKFDTSRVNSEFKITESNLIAWEWQNLDENKEASGNFSFNLIFYIVNKSDDDVCFINRIYDIGTDLKNEIWWRPTGGNCKPLVFGDEYKIKVVKDMYSRAGWDEKNESVTFSEPFKFVVE